MNKKERSNFTGTLGFVMAAAGSAVGLGNIWRFPYLAAKDNGGVFILVYIILALTFGFTLLTTDIAIGRKTRQGPLTAYGLIHKKWKWLGGLAWIVPVIILPYYCTIGGWVLKYMTAYFTGQTEAATGDGYFTGFITAQTAPIVFALIFLTATGVVVFCGVEKGIEKFSKVLMPILVILIHIKEQFIHFPAHTQIAKVYILTLFNWTSLFLLLYNVTEVNCQNRFQGGKYTLHRIHSSHAHTFPVSYVPIGIADGQAGTQKHTGADPHVRRLWNQYVGSAVQRIHQEYPAVT